MNLLVTIQTGWFIAFLSLSGIFGLLIGLFVAGSATEESMREFFDEQNKRNRIRKHF